jgi:hypothetical protein
MDMKYSESNKPLVCMQTNSTCYKGTGKMTVKGVLWHSTGANNPNLKRYVQPSDNASDREKMLKLLGVNPNKNDWNHIYRQAGLNCWIGKLADGTVTTVQTMPWDYKPWGCGSGSKGSCNDGWIQFEICEGSLTDKAYFNAVYKEACEITAYLCDMYNLDPYGTVTKNGVKVPVILCHADSYKYGMGSNHGDVLHWFKKHGKTMDDVRKDVAELMGKKTETPKVEEPKVEKPTTPTTVELKIGDAIKLVSGAKYTSGKAIPTWVVNSTVYVRDIRANGDVVFSLLKIGAVTGVVNPKYITKNGQSVNTTTPTKPSVTTPTQQTDLKIGDAVKLTSGAKYVGGKSIPNWVLQRTLYVRDFRSDGSVVISVLKVGAITGAVEKKYLTKV